MNRIVIIFGIIAGSIVSLMLIVSFSLGGFESDYGEIAGYASMILAFVTIFFAIRSYRDKHLEGRIGFGKAFLIGLYITLISSTIYVASWMIISETIAKDFTQNYTEHAIKKLNESDLSKEEIKVKIEEINHFAELYSNPVFKAGITYMEILPVGLLVSLISAAFLRKKKSFPTYN